MFEEIIRQENVRRDVPVEISRFVRQAQRVSGNHRLVEATKRAIIHFSDEEGFLKKTELLELWRSENVGFACKALATIWWGGPNYQLERLVYSSSNLDEILMLESLIRRDLETLSQIEDFDEFITSLKSLFCKFERDGEYHIAGVDVAFFTKIFHFWFASHPIASCPGFLPIIADKWIKLAVYAEMADSNDDSRFELFSVRNGNPDSIDFRRNHGNADDAYVQFILYFNSVANNLNERYSELTPFMLEDILFNESRVITPLFVRKDYQSIFLPPWVAGRYNNQEKVAIIFNNLCGESLFFEDESAQLVGELLKTDYWRPIDVDNIISTIQCTECELLAFFAELAGQHIVEDHILAKEEIDRIRKRTAVERRRFLKKSRGTENLQTVFEIADTDYRDRIEKQHIPSTVSFELTYACNEVCLHCYNPGSLRTECIAKKVASNEMVYNDYCSVLDQLAEMGVPKILFTGGDPFMKKDFIKILQYAHQKKFAITIYTNGQSLYNHSQRYNDIIDCYPYRIGLSLYSVDPDIHERITRINGSCQKTKTIAEKLSNDGVNLLIKCPIMRMNKDGYKKVYKYAISLNAVPEFEVNITSSVEGDKYAVETLRLNEDEMIVILKDPMIPLSTERKNVTRMMERSPQMHFCGAGIDSVNIKPNGEVSPCIAFTAPCGNVKDLPFKQIWTESAYLNRVRKLTYGDSDKCGTESYCKYCNRCIGQSYTDKGLPENYSEDNCFIARIREKIDNQI